MHWLWCLGWKAWRQYDLLHALLQAKAPDDKTTKLCQKLIIGIRHKEPKREMVRLYRIIEVL